MADRFTSNQIRENINEREHLFVPGVTIFNNDSLTNWLATEKGNSDPQVNLSLLFYEFPKWFIDERRIGVKANFSKIRSIEDVGDLRFRIRFPNNIGGTIRYKRDRGELIYEGRMSESDKGILTDISNDPNFQRAIENLFIKTNLPDPQQGDSKEPPHDYKKEHLEDIIALSAKKPQSYASIKDRYFYDCCQAGTFTMTTRTRLLVGFSGGSVFENFMGLHPCYGFPVISASGLKGLARHFCEEYLKPDGKVDDSVIKKVFGNEPGERDVQKLSEGEVTFMDAWPDDWPVSDRQTQPLLEIDIINSHYPEYYREGSTQAPKDNQSPVPIIFLAVKKGITFRFCVKPSSLCTDTNIISATAGFLKGALIIFGAGAKTGSSYGYFR